MKGAFMIDSYKPTWLLEAIYHVTPEQLKKHHIKGILTDLDNTLIAWDNPHGTEELLNWLLAMKDAGIPVVVVSNNNEQRVAKALEKFDLDFVARALKPFSKGIKEGAKKLNLHPSELVMVGDQLMTDIKAANAAGMRSILVKPVVPTDSWKTKFNRWVEKKVMRKLKEKYPDMKWRRELT